MRSGDAQRGFGYLLLLFALAAMGLVLAGAGQVWHTSALREKEAQLLFAGNQFREAIASYYENSPGTKQYPASLEDLLEDRRLPQVRRHLRRIYADPLTGAGEWGLIKAEGRILGVHSLASGRPFKSGDFLPRDEAFAGAQSYADWRFLASQVQGSRRDAAAQAREGAAPGAPEAAPPRAADMPPAADSPSPSPEVACSGQYTAELQQCQAARSRASNAAFQACTVSAAARYSACRHGSAPPPLELPG